MASTLAGFHQACRAVYGSPSPQWIAPPPVPQALLDQFYNTEENLMAPSFDPNSYGKADAMDNCCTSTPESGAQWAKRTRKEAKRAEKAARSERKRNKKAKRQQQQREDDIACAFDTLVDVAYESDDPQARVEAASRILIHYLNF